MTNGYTQWIVIDDWTACPGRRKTLIGWQTNANARCLVNLMRSCSSGDRSIGLPLSLLINIAGRCYSSPPHTTGLIRLVRGRATAVPPPAAICYIGFDELIVRRCSCDRNCFVTRSQSDLFDWYGPANNWCKSWRWQVVYVTGVSS